MLKAPFTGEPAEVFKTEWRYAGMPFTEKGVALTNEFDRADADAPHVDVRERVHRRTAQGVGAAVRRRLRRSRHADVTPRRRHRSCRSATTST